MPALEPTPATFTRLQARAVPLVDTIESVINRLLDTYEGESGKPILKAKGGDRGEIRLFSAVASPSLAHTKVLAIELDGKPLSAARRTGTACWMPQHGWPRPGLTRLPS